MNRLEIPSEVIWTCKWFDLIARRPESFAEPHYSIRTQDYVGVVALDNQGRCLLVRQLRPAVNGQTLEFPGGHVEPGETPEQAARKELLEETGHVAEKFELTAVLLPDTGRLCNRLWCFFAEKARPLAGPGFAGEEGVHLIVYDKGFPSLLVEPEFGSALNWAALLAAMQKGFIRLDKPTIGDPCPT